MNRAMIRYILGIILKAEAAMFALPLVFALYYREDTISSYLIVMGLTLLVGSLLSGRKKPAKTAIYAKEGFVIVSLAWTLMSIFGAMPFTLTGSIPNFVDAFFETVSGFTTTGSTILTEIEGLPKSILMWRSFTHFIGGMGILVFLMIISPLAENRNLHIMRAEVPGPVKGKVAPKMKDTARILYSVYIGLTVLLVLLLMVFGMDFYDSLLHAFSTAGTGGFSSRNLSIAAYESQAIRMTLAVFMVLFGLNFNFFILAIAGNFKDIIKSKELQVFLGIILAATLSIAMNIRHLYDGFGMALSDSFFQVTSIISTTGFGTANFDVWPEFSKAILLILMFCGANSGSTGGGLKTARLMLLFGIMKQEFRTILHPRSVGSVKLDGKHVSPSAVRGAGIYMLFYIATLMIGLLLVSLEGYPFSENFTAMVSCLNNIGPGFGAVGPIGNFAHYGMFSKLVFSLTMLMGRLEIYPFLVTFNALLKPGRR